MAHQQPDDDPFEGIDPHKKLEDSVHRFWAAKEIEESEELIDVTPIRLDPDPAPAEIRPEPGPEDDDPADGEAV
jgi:hypothetical protein